MKKTILSIMMLSCMTAAMAQDASIPVSEDGYYMVETLQQFQDAVKNNLSDGGTKSHSKIRLAADLYLSDLSERTFNNTFCGTLDGAGHTIWAARPEVQHDGGGHYKRCYLFTYANGNAVFKNLNFKDIRVQSDDRDNMAIVVTTATNCTFQNITFDNVSIWTDENNVGAVTGIADNCVIENITVMNSDFSVDGRWCAAIVGKSSNSKYRNCFVDDQTAVYADGKWISSEANAGGIAATADHDEFVNCINSGVVAGFCNGQVGGIVGFAENHTKIESCLNTGIIMAIDVDKMENFMTNIYKKLSIVKRSYNGKIYDVRTELPSEEIGYDWQSKDFGGIVGYLLESSISKCANIGYMACAANNDANVRVAGIAGESKSSSISDCLNAALLKSWNDKAFGILGCATWWGDGTVVKNCLSLTDTKIFDNDDKNNMEGSGNNYSTNNYTQPYAEVVDKEMPVSGELASKLSTCWEQNLGTDPYPTPTGDRWLYHTRTYTKKYGTVCLPFPMKSDKNISFYTFSENSSSDFEVVMKFNYAEEVEAGTPVLYRVTGDVSADNPVEITINNTGRRFAQFPSNSNPGEWELHGTYKELVFTGNEAESIYYLSDGAIKNAKKTTVAPYRAYFRGPNINTGDNQGSNPGGYNAKAIRLVLEDNNGETTSIDLVNDELQPAQHNKTYSLMGTEVGEGYRGIVIQNGKKVWRK